MLFKCTLFPHQRTRCAFFNPIKPCFSNIHYSPITRGRRTPTSPKSRRRTWSSSGWSPSSLADSQPLYPSTRSPRICSSGWLHQSSDSIFLAAQTEWQKDRRTRQISKTTERQKTERENHKKTKDRDQKEFSTLPLAHRGYARQVFWPPEISLFLNIASF